MQRLLALLCVLADVEKITVQEFADRFEVSKRTIFRDLEALSCAGIPIVSYPGVGGGVSVFEGYKIGKQILSNPFGTKTQMRNMFATNGHKPMLTLCMQHGKNSLL